MKKVWLLLGLVLLSFALTHPALAQEAAKVAGDKLVTGFGIYSAIILAAGIAVGISCMWMWSGNGACNSWCL